jgi:hypothetical protein
MDWLPILILKAFSKERQEMKEKEYTAIYSKGE